MKFARIVLVAMVFALIIGVIPTTAGAADPQFVANLEVDNTQEFVEGEPLAPGQVQAGKFVEFTDDARIFVITLFCEGANFFPPNVDIVAGDPGINPLNPDSAGVTVVDVIGPQFKPVLSTLPADVTYDAATNTITWVVPVDKVTEDTEWREFQVELQDGWDLGVWYYTNADAYYTFVPIEGNPFYFDMPVNQIIEAGFTLGEVSWNHRSGVGGINSLNISDAVHGVLPEMDFNNANVDSFVFGGKTYVLADSDPTNPGAYSDGYYGFYVNTSAEVIDYTIWINGLDGPGSTTTFDVRVENYGGNEELATAGVKTVTFTQWVAKAGIDWNEGVATVALTNNGRIMIEEVIEKDTIPPTGDASSALNIITLIGMLALGAGLTRKFK